MAESVGKVAAIAAAFIFERSPIGAIRSGRVIGTG